MCYVRDTGSKRRACVSQSALTRNEHERACPPFAWPGVLSAWAFVRAPVSSASLKGCALSAIDPRPVARAGRVPAPPLRSRPLCGPRCSGHWGRTPAEGADRGRLPPLPSRGLRGGGAGECGTAQSQGPDPSSCGPALGPGDRVTGSSWSPDVLLPGSSAGKALCAEAAAPSR